MRHGLSVSLPSIVLASSSPRRQELLRQCGVEFEVVPAAIPELHDEALTAREVSLLNAHRKARAVAKRFPDRVVLGADTLVVRGRRLYGKPVDLAHARRMMAELAGHTHQVVTGVCLLRLRNHRERLFAEITDVTFRALDAQQIDAYLAGIDPLDKAGAYAIQNHGDRIVAEIAGSYSNVVGLPVERVLEALRGWEAP